MDFILDVTHFKTKAGWGTDSLKELPTATKSALTRAINAAGLVPRCGMMTEDVKRRRGARAAPTPELEGAAPETILHDRHFF